MTAAACAFWNDDAPVLCIFHARAQMTRVSGGASYADVIFLPSFAAFLLRAPLAMLLRPRCVYNKRRWRCAASKMVAKQRCSPNSLIHTHPEGGRSAKEMAQEIHSDGFAQSLVPGRRRWRHRSEGIEKKDEQPCIHRYT